MKKIPSTHAYPGHVCEAFCLTEAIQDLRAAFRRSQRQCPATTVDVHLLADIATRKDKVSVDIILRKEERGVGVPSIPTMNNTAA